MITSGWSPFTRTEQSRARISNMRGLIFGDNQLTLGRNNRERMVWKRKG
jgi:hypothetical protein